MTYAVLLLKNDKLALLSKSAIAFSWDSTIYRFVTETLAAPVASLAFSSVSVKSSSLLA